MTKDANSPAEVARSAERQQDKNQADSFAPEGTDETVLRPDGDRPLSEEDRLKATQKVLDQSSPPQ